MAELEIAATPEAVGMDAARLQRVRELLQRYVDQGQLPSWVVVIARRGRVCWVGMGGSPDGSDRAIDPSGLYRLHSMTKPVTSVAAMMLAERGTIDLRAPVSEYLPEFARPSVFRRGAGPDMEVEPAARTMRLWHLMTHTSGLTYGANNVHAVDGLYRQAGFTWGRAEDSTLEQSCRTWASLPLLFEPGTSWNYGVSTDVLGRVIEVVAGCSLAHFFQHEIFDPLGMTDTAFWVDERNAHRLVAMHAFDESAGRAALVVDSNVPFMSRPEAFSGGGGLVSSAGDYQRFIDMLSGGGLANGCRILGPRSLAYMTRNHLPGDADIETFRPKPFPEGLFDGVGYGLGFAVVVNPAQQHVVCSGGEFGWWGAAGTRFWVDPSEQLSVLFMTHLMPPRALPIEARLRHTVYQAIVEEA